MYQKILIAIDGSDLAVRGQSHGLELAMALDKPVVFVMTTAPFEMLEQIETDEIVNPIEFYAEFSAKEAQKVLSVAEETAKTLGVPCECVHVKDRHPAVGIIETVVSHHCDLIVIASRIQTGVKRVFLGSVASEVLNLSRVPVLIVRC